jgi:prepilin-type N-terminal cleavage/methylation domain-containing protein
MKNKTRRLVGRIKAFTLIELMVVISIIALLAAMIVPLAGNMARKQRLTRALGELAQIETAIEAYKAARGHFPPDNPVNPARPQLFYELTGTVYQDTLAQHTFRRINGTETINQSDFPAAFGNGPQQVEGFVNSSYVQNWSDSAQVRAADARDFFPTLKTGQYLLDANNVAFLGIPVDGPDEVTSPDGRRINPWRYNSSSPTNNADSFDLWMDITLKGKTNRICNWSDNPVILN